MGEEEEKGWEELEDWSGLGSTFRTLSLESKLDKGERRGGLDGVVD